MFLAMLLAAAWAQDAPPVPELSAQLYRPPTDSRHTLWTDGTGSVVSGLKAEGRAVLQYVNRPFVWVPDPGVDAEKTALVSDALQFDGIGVLHAGRFRLGVVVPMYVFQAGQLTQNGGGIGDVALDGRVTFLDKSRAALGLAASVEASLPTATTQAPLGSARPMVDATLLIDDELGPLLLAANLGTRIGPSSTLDNVDLGDQLLYRLGAGYALTPDTGLSFDLGGQLAYSAPLSNPAGAPLEGMVGAWGRVSSAMVLRAGVGRGLTPGIGSPVARVVTMLSLEPRGIPDTDGDGLIDTVDRCPLQLEDFDGVDDDDGCPDLD